MKSLLLIDYPHATPNALARILSELSKADFKESEDITCLIFVDDPGMMIVNALKDKIPAKRVEVLNPSLLMDEYALKFRRMVCDNIYLFYEKWIKLMRRKLKSSESEFLEQWWYSDIPERNSPAEDNWWIWLHFYIVSQLLAGGVFRKVYCIGGKKLTGLVTQECRRRDLEFKGLYEYREKEMMRTLWVCALMRLGSFFTLLFAALFSRLRWPGGIAAEKKNALNSLIYFPLLWSSRAGSDLYYGPLVKNLRDSGIKVNYLAWLFDFRVYSTGIPQMMKRLSVLEKFKGQLGDFILFERHIRIRHLVKAFFNLSHMTKAASVLRDDEWKQFFVIDGINFGGLLKPLFWRSVILHWPHADLVKATAGIIAKKTEPIATLHYCFEYKEGRAFLKGTRSESARPIYGLQHGPITHMQFEFYRTEDEIKPKSSNTPPAPLPDCVIVDGELAREILTDRGMGFDKVAVCGPVRFDGKWPERPFKAKKSAEDEISILIAPGLHDNDFVLTFVLKSLEEGGIKDNIKFILKPHPRLPRKGLKEIELIAKNNKFHIDIVTEGSIYDWFEKADGFITTYSSVGVEALAYGLKIFVLRSNWLPDMSPFFKQELESVSIIREFSELTDALRNFRADAGKISPQMNAKFVRYVFGDPDNKCSDRIRALMTESMSVKQ